ncbi:hypothetical protein [Priestia koreensis]|uniref:Uncharacterized protein n=1 Tax=Priestia koreensis TaxID=284581 RepID=A0A0M0KVP1_9BACI|nr:hypothetical protein [Priestia koreensis]KOO42889.1 hypothetical protein AMD01_17260 [Priestia koreensis]
MQIFSTFEHSSFLELAIASLEERGVNSHNIFAVPLNTRKSERKIFDTIHYADGVSLIDLAMGLATALSVIGASIGFKLAWGPIYWGLIGAATGFVIGLAIKWGYFKLFKPLKGERSSKPTEVILIVECSGKVAAEVEQILWDHLALGVAIINGEENKKDSS